MSDSLIYKILFLLLTLFFLKVILIDNNYSYPESIAHVKHINTEEKNNLYVSKIKKYCNIIYKICKIDSLNYHTFRIVNFRLFNAHHVFGLYQYRVIHELSDGSMIEPVKVFNEDLSSNQSASLFSTRYLQALLYSVSDAVREMRKDDNSEIPVRLNKVFNVLCSYSASKTSYENIVKHYIYVVPMDVPTTYVGSNKPWLKHKWQKFYEVDIISSSSTYHQVSFDDSTFFPTSRNRGFHY